MGILGIDNRTENWKTAERFAPLFRDANARKALAVRLCEPKSTRAGQIKLELFWKGMRDHIYWEKEKGVSDEALVNDFAGRYNSLFPDLCREVDGFKVIPAKGPSYGFSKLKGHNYNLATKNSRSDLYNNLRNSEIDIVLESPMNLFIGEAKDESELDADPSYVLVHQLIRQYVMATILVDRIADCYNGKRKKIVPFIVVAKSKLAKTKRSTQVRFMIDKKGWLKDKHVLTWDNAFDLRYMPTGDTKSGERDRRYNPTGITKSGRLDRRYRD